MAVEMFDYLDDVIALQATSKFNSKCPLTRHTMVYNRLFNFSFQLNHNIPRKFHDFSWTMSTIAINTIDSRFQPVVRFSCKNNVQTTWQFTK